MEMNYKHLSQVLAQKYSSRVGVKVLLDVSYSDAKELIENIVDDTILLGMLKETEKIKTDRDLSHIKLLLNKRIHRPASC